MANSLTLDFSKRFQKGAEISLSTRMDFDQAPLQVFFGPSGSGKSTLLRCLAGLERPDRGFIQWGDEPWFNPSKRSEWTPQQRRIGYVSQNPSLFPHLNVFKNLRFGVRSNFREKKRKLEKLIARLELEEFLERYPAQLSGGQKQRVALARALAVGPRLLMLDEPFSSLDQPNREILRSWVKSILAEFETPACLVTHDRVEVFSLGNEVHLLDQGRVLERGAISQVFLQPRTLRAAQIVGVENILSFHSRSFAIRAEDVSILLHAGEGEGEGEGQRKGDVGESEKKAAIEFSERIYGRIESIIPEGPMSRVKLQGVHPLVALVPRRSVLDHGLRSGLPAVALLPRDRVWEVH